MALLKKTVGAQRWIWNHFLSINKERYEESGHFMFYNEMASELTNLKGQEETAWLKEIPSQTLQQTLKDLEKAIKNCYELGFGFPEFKKFNDDKHSARFPQFFVLSKNEVTLPKLGKFKFQSRKNVHKKDINYVTLSYDRIKNQWLLSVNFDTRIKQLPKTDKKIGLDVGSVRMYTDNTGKYKKPVRELKKVEYWLSRLEKEQRKLSDIIEQLKPLKETEESESSEKRHLLFLKRRKVKTVGLIYRKMTDYIHDKLHKLTTKLVKSHDLIATEDLNLKGMTKSAAGTVEEPGKNVKQKTGLNRNLLSNRLGLFFSLLRYKSLWYGKTFVQVYAPGTSRTCSSCGFKSKKNRQKQAEFKCIKCGFELNADHNAAINILNRGLKQLGLTA